MICSVGDCDKPIYSKKSGLCSMHYTRMYRYGSTDKPLTEKERLFKQKKATCPSCGETKNLSDFNCDKQAPRGISIYCKLCQSKKGKNRYKKYKHKYVDYSLRHDFGISLNEYKDILQQQGGGCAICGRIKSKNGRRLAVDHCHDSGKIRGLLCDQCNVALGHFQDDIENLKKAIEYLKNAKIKTEE